MKKYVSCLGLFLLMSFQLNAQSLIERIRAGDWDQVRKIANRDNVNQVDKNQASPLMWAVYKADLNLVRFLVDLGADLHIKGTISIDNQGSYYGSLVGIAAGPLCNGRPIPAVIRLLLI
ncbi:MAG: hypothetical protein NTV01_03135 [Bacteroidia bacterium]|nr:hypothetical protein [Bacteroidia bacterium]